MAMARHWLFRVSVAANLFVLVYLALYSSSSVSPTPNSVEQVNLGGSSTTNEHELLLQPEASRLQLQQPSQSDGPPFKSTDMNNNVVDMITSNNNNLISNSNSNSIREVQQQQQFVTGEEGAGDSEDNIVPEDFVGGGGGQESRGNKDFSLESTNIEENMNKVTVEKVTPAASASKLFPCDDYTPRSFYGQRGPFWVLYNYLTASRKFGCDESITYTTHADFTFLENLVPLLERWQGPISLSLYSPGTDFGETLSRIVYLRECSSPLVKEFVNFHLFFDHKHMPKVKIPMDPSSITINCSGVEPPKFGEGIITYKKAKKLPYPVNVARNVAREMASTHYILPSDIELYPNPNLIPDFLDLLRRNDTEIQRPRPKLFVLSIFEVEANVTALPYDKRELVYMLHNKSAIPFHKYVCADCHRIPKANEWISAPFQSGMRVFHIGKRHKPYHHWEPIYIGTKFTPNFDERLTWEGRSDKMTQGYVLCVLDYEFHILDNAFLVHRPGIKRTKVIPKKNPVVAKQNTVIAKIILPELKLLYGTKPGCYV